MARVEKSEVLAWPRRWAMWTVTPSDLSRLRSTFSNSPLRTLTDRPQPSEASAAASVAPSFLAWARARSTSSSKNGRLYLKPLSGRCAGAAAAVLGVWSVGGFMAAAMILAAAQRLFCARFLASPVCVFCAFFCVLCRHFLCLHPMSRKLQKGYFVKGRFVAEGSAQDVQFKAERKGRPDASRTDLKRESAGLQALGKELLDLRADLFDALGLPDDLVQALAEARRITDFEGKRRHWQYGGKIRPRLDPALVQAARQALATQRKGSAAEKLLLHQTELWRDRLVADDAALLSWMAAHPGTDTQQLRALIRQARKSAPAAGQAALSQGLAPRKGRAYRELFQLVRGHLGGADVPDMHQEHDDE